MPPAPRSSQRNRYRTRTAGSRAAAGRSKDLRFDAAVIGGGSAGYAAARALAAGGLRTGVIEGARELGGLCILRGCMPTKALLQSAEMAHLVRKAPVWGVRGGRVRVDYGAVMARKARLIREFAGYRAGQLQDGRFSLVRQQARFLDPHTLQLDDGRTVQAGHFVVATGSRVAPPPSEALARVGYWTSDDALRARRLPRSLVVLGGGAVAVEFAQYFQRMGVRVTLIQRSPHILREFDEDAATVVEGVFRREGMRVFTDTRLLDARVTRGGKVVVFQHEGRVRRVGAEQILLALGRVPNVDRLDLARAGVALEGGRIRCDDRMRTSAPHIFAAGDCTGPHDVVHVAIRQGEVAAGNILQPASPTRTDDRLLITVVFTDPQVACVGLTERAAAAQGVSVRVARYPFDDHGKSMILDALDGFVKLLASADGEIVGGCCVGPQGGELIHEIVAAMHGRMTAAQLAAMPHYHPTLAEIWTYPAEALAEPT